MLEVLNPEQRMAVTTTDGPLLVLAGAGSGKTRVITFRIAYLIGHGTAANRILAVTFTNKAAQEMQQRASMLLGNARKQEDKPFISTFHSLCVNILKDEIHLLGYPNRFAIHDRNDQESLARSALRDVKCPTTKLKPSDLLYKIGQWKCQGLRAHQVNDVLEDDRDVLAAAAYGKYERALKAAGALDFDDLLLCTEELFREHESALERQQRRFDHILVDEYQDTNGTQFRIISLLARPHRNLCVVGDDDQSIYGWRGADVENILGFDREYTDACVVRLESNYRCVPEVLALANQLILHNPYRREKELRPVRPSGHTPRFLEFEDELDEAKRIVGEIDVAVKEKKLPPRNFAILFRTNEQPRLFESELRAAKLPYVLIGGMSFFDRREVRDLLAYLKLISNPEDEMSLLRVINRPARGIGDGSIKKLLAKAVERGVSLWHVLADAASDGEIQHRSAEAIVAFRNKVEAWQGDFQEKSLTIAFQDLISEIDYQSEINRNYEQGQDRINRWKTVEEIVNAVSQYEEKSREPTLAEFIQEIALVGREDDNSKESKLDRDAIVLMTLHSAKGLEFPYVYLVGMEEGLLPHERAIKEGITAITEERRLAYVGITRARDVLTLSLAESRTKWGKRRPSKPSRFLAEMRGEVELPKKRKSPPRTRKKRKPQKAR